MFNPEAELISLMKNAGTDFVSSLPCEKIKTLLQLLGETFPHLPLTREEEGVGISAGAALAGKRPAMFVQSSGVGNMLNALLSLNQFYELPLALFVSQRGVYKERIAAQLPMGQRLPAILKGAGIGCSVIGSVADFRVIGKKLADVYRKNRIHAFLLSPAIWEGSEAKAPAAGSGLQAPNCSFPQAHDYKTQAPRYTRYEILEILAPWLKGKAVACNLGIPSKELYAILPQSSNFYMLGSMGMVTPVGLGISLTSEKEVVVIDGDGSILMNPGTLATVAFSGPNNLTIVGIDNSSYGSTGNQLTLTGSCVDLARVAQGFGMHNTIKAATRKELVAAMKLTTSGPKFIHALSVSGNSDAPNIPLGHIEIKEQVQQFLKG